MLTVCADNNAHKNIMVMNVKVFFILLIFEKKQFQNSPGHVFMTKKKILHLNQFFFEI